MISREETSSQKAKTIFIKSLICFLEGFFPLGCYPLGQGTWKVDANFSSCSGTWGALKSISCQGLNFPSLFYHTVGAEQNINS